MFRNFQCAQAWNHRILGLVSHQEERKMKFTRPSATIAAKWLLILSLMLVPNLAWGPKNKSSGGGGGLAAKAAPSAPHSSAPSGGGSHPGGGTTTANHGGSGATTAN